MVRKLALAVAGCWIGVAAPVWGLGLGDIHVSSSLNQSFSGSIDLRDLADLNADEVIVTLGSAEDFARAKLDRSFFLQDFRYQVQVKGGGSGVIRVTSSRPITEPVVEFLVSVVWPNGRLQRQYTVLLDPPGSRVAANSSSTESGGTGGDEADAAPDVAVTRPAISHKVRRTTHSDRVRDGSFGPTSRSDTLWRIAARIRPSRDVTVHQTMLALQRLNPDAFIDANINRLKAGYTLRVPDSKQVQELGSSDAMAEVARQANAWRGGDRATTAQSGAPVEGTPEPTRAAPAEAARDVVRIVSGNKSKQGKASANPPGPAKEELEQKLAGSKEEQDRLALENADATKKLAAAAASTTQLQQQVAARDQELVVLNRQMAEMRASVEKLKSAPPAAGATPAVSGPTPPAPGLFDTWLGKSLAAALLAALAGLIGLYYMFNRERTHARLVAKDKAELNERLERTVRLERERTGNTVRPGVLTAAAPAVAMASTVAATTETKSAPRPSAPVPRPVTATVFEMANTQDTEYLDKTIMLADPGEVARAAAAEDVVAASDVVSEADIYIAYGRFPQAISFLQSALEKEPERIDARLKLMEAYVETRDGTAFGLEAQALLERKPNEAELRRARQLQARLPGVTVIPAEKMADTGVDFDKTIIDTSMADRALVGAANSPSAVELDLDLDHTDLLGGIAPEKPLDVDLSRDGKFGAKDADALDFNLTLDGLDDNQGDQLGGDLGLSFRDDGRQGGPNDFDRTFSPEDPASPEDEFGLDLTVDGRTSHVEPARRAARPISPENDEGLSLTLDGKDDDFTPPSRPVRRDAQIIANADTVETTPIEEDLDFLSDAPDEARTKLDLARAYIDMGDGDAARDVLQEVLMEGSDSHQQEARELLSKLA